MFYSNNGSMALSLVVSEIFNVEKYRDLEIPVKSQSRSMKVVPFDRLGMVACSSHYLTYMDVNSLRHRPERSAACRPWGGGIDYDTLFHEALLTAIHTVHCNIGTTTSVICYIC